MFERCLQYICIRNCMNMPEEVFQVILFFLGEVKGKRFIASNKI